MLEEERERQEQDRLAARDLRWWAAAGAAGASLLAQVALAWREVPAPPVLRGLLLLVHLLAALVLVGETVVSLVVRPAPPVPRAALAPPELDLPPVVLDQPGPPEPPGAP